MEIALPHLMEYRPYQKEVRQGFLDGFKRFILVRHRRAGKDKACFNLCVEQALKRKGMYFYVFPEYAQGKKALWDAIDKDGIKVTDHIHPALVSNKNNTEMKITLVNGSIIQIVGSDKYDALMGTNPVGLVFSEYSLQDPQVWDYMRPILLENGGRALFNYTPRGKNHGHTLLEKARANEPEWFISIKKATQTFDNDGKRVLTDAQLESERIEMDEETFEQEYMCSFSGGIKGAYFTKRLTEMEKEGRITTVPYESALPVHTVRDLGMRDSTSIIFFQLHGKEIRKINHYESSGQGLEVYARHLQTLYDEKGYRYGNHYLPHDIEVREMGTGMSRKQVLEGYGLKNIVIVPNIPVQDGIEAIRAMFKYFWIDKSLTRIIDCLRDYHKEYDEKNKIFKDNPKHDRTSHTVDAVRYLCVVVKKLMDDTNRKTPNSFTPDYSNQV